MLLWASSFFCHTSDNGVLNSSFLTTHLFNTRHLKESSKLSSYYNFVIIEFIYHALIIFWISFTDCKQLNETNTQKGTSNSSVLMNPQMKEMQLVRMTIPAIYYDDFMKTLFFSTLDMLQTRLKKIFLQYQITFNCHNF